MADRIGKVLRKKGYGVVVKKDKHEKGDPADAILAIGYKAETVGRGAESRHIIRGAAELSVTAGAKKVVISRPRGLPLWRKSARR